MSSGHLHFEVCSLFEQEEPNSTSVTSGRLTRVVGVVCGLLLHHHVGWGEPVRVGVRMGVGVGSVPVSRSTPVPGARHVGRPLVQRVQVFLLEALLQVGHAGVGVLAVVAPASAPSTTWTPTPSHPAAAMSGRGRGHALKGLCWWRELGAHGLPRRALVPGTDQSQRRRYSRPRPKKQHESVSCEDERWTVAVSPGVDGEAVAGQRLRGGSGVHVAGVGPSGRGGFGGVMLLHGRHGGPGTGALGPSCTSFLLIGTENRGEHEHNAHSQHKIHN